MPPKQNQAACRCLKIEQIEKIIAVRLNDQFEKRFDKLKDNVVTLMAEKLSTIGDENSILKSTLANEVADLRNWQNDINKKMEDLQSDKKQITVIHELVNTFNGKLTEIEENSKQSVQHVHEDVQSINENICEMLNEVPQVTLSSLETRFSNIEEKLSNSFETIVSKDTSLMTVTNMTSESNVSQDEFLSEVANEVDERQKRKKSLVIHNIEETDNAAEDKLQVTNVLNEIIDDENRIKQQQSSIYRLGKRSSVRNRTIKVHFKSEEVCSKILQNTRKLRETNQYKHIVIQPDLTPVQRQHLKLLVDEKKQRNWFAAQNKEEPDWIIRRGKLCRRRDLTIL